MEDMKATAIILNLEVDYNCDVTCVLGEIEFGI